MSFGDLETPALREAAYQEAEELVVDPAQLEGRERLEGLVIGSAGSFDRGMAVSLGEHEGSVELRVSLADVASFIPVPSALQAYAQRMVASACSDNGVVYPMIPREISENKLSLVEGQERPVLTVHMPVNTEGIPSKPRFTKDVLTASFLTTEQADMRFSDGDALLIQLDAIARQLFASRHDNPDMPLFLQDELGDITHFDQGVIGRFILQESRFALNATVAAFMRLHGIAGIFRTHGLTFDEEGSYEDPSLPPTYSSQPLKHLALGLPAYTHADRPLGRYADFATQVNLLAHLEGRPQPIRGSSLAHAIRRLSQNEAEGHEAFYFELPEAVEANEELSSLDKQTRELAQLELRFDKGTTREIDITHALFGKLAGTPERIFAIRRLAADILGKNIPWTRTVLEYALQKGWLTRRVQPDASFVICDAAGNQYPYVITGNKLKDYLTLTKLIGSISGMSIEPTIPPSLTPEGKIRHEPIKYLMNQRRALGIELGYSIHRDEQEGTVTIKARFTLPNHGPDLREVTAHSLNEAERQLGNALIDEYDLMGILLNPPRIQPKEKAPSKPDKNQPGKKGQTNPVSVLAVHAARNYVDNPRYENTTPDDADPNGPKECTLHFIGADGEPQTVKATDNNFQNAKNKAAAAALQTLPPVPPKRKKKKTTTENPTEPMET